MPSNIERKARRKKQTRLTFDAVDRSSSPAHMSTAKAHYSLPSQRSTPLSSMQPDPVEDTDDDILASSKKSSVKRSPASRSKNGKLPFKALPTPAKSSQMGKISSFFDTDEEDEIETNHHQTRRQTSRSFMGSASSSKQRLLFTDKDSSDGSPPEEEEVITPSRRKRNARTAVKGEGDLEKFEDSITVNPEKNTRSSAARRTTKSRREKSVTLSDSDDHLALPPPKSAKRSRSLFRSSNRNSIAKENSDSPIVSSVRRSTRQSTIINNDESEDELPVHSSRVTRSSAGRKPVKGVINLDEDSDDIVASPAKRRPPVIVPGFDEESDEDPISSPLKRRRANVNTETEEDQEVSPSKRPRQAPENEDEDDSDLPEITRVNRRGMRGSSSKGPATPNRLTRQQKPKRHRTAKEKTMELLKRKRAGENITELTESESDSELEGGIYDSDAELKALSEFEDEEESPEAVQRPKRTQRRGSNEDQDHYDSDFVIDDDDAPIGVPDVGLFDIPLQFTHAAHKPLKEHFKDAVEWMVHNKINPAFNRDDPLYVQAFKKLDTEYAGLAKSKFTSTQWTAEFTRAIEARPECLLRQVTAGEGFDFDGVPKCDACNHRKHIPSVVIQFTGKAYNKKTLEEIEYSDDEDDDNDEEEHVSVDENGQELPPETKEWFSGSVCAENANQAHRLIHWKYALNDWVVQNLENEGELTPAKLAERDKMKPKQRREYANNLVDEWENHRQIKDLYRDFKLELETARNSSTGRWSRKKGPGAERDYD